MPRVNFSDEERSLIRKTLGDVDLGLKQIDDKFRQKLSCSSESNNLEYSDYEEILEEICKKYERKKSQKLERVITIFDSKKITADRRVLKASESSDDDSEEEFEQSAAAAHKKPEVSIAKPMAQKLSLAEQELG